MAIQLQLRVEQDSLIVTFDDQRPQQATPLAVLPSLAQLQADRFGLGRTLTTALGGEGYLLPRLDNDPDNLLLLQCDDGADGFAWEFAACADGQFLCVKTGMLRLLERDAHPARAAGPLNFVALAADPLVDEQGRPRDGQRLDLDNELKAIRATLQECGKELDARRVPPTRQELNNALLQGPALLHLTCHGNVVTTPSGPQAMLWLEKPDASPDPLSGGDLLNMATRGVLRLVLLSACLTATGTQANLARALVHSGVPAAIGMQGTFPDPLSDDLAAALYAPLLLGYPLGEALRQARLALAISKFPETSGLLAGYVTRNSWQTGLELREGTPRVARLGKPGRLALGGEIQPPRPLLGRSLELHQLARLFSGSQRVVTLAGTGGMGKTALAAAFAERFAWRWPRGVQAYSFASGVDYASFSSALLRALEGEERAQQAATQPESVWREAILRGAAEWDGLWLFDNYESVSQGLREGLPAAAAIHRLVADLASGGARLLLTSREQPAGLDGERLFPEKTSLPGLGAEAGAQLFLRHSSKADPNEESDQALARAIQAAAEGHPLAIALLAGEYDVSPVAREKFLGEWQSELNSAHRASLAGHHTTFTIAFARSYDHLDAPLQNALTRLSVFPFPFLAQALAVLDGTLPTQAVDGAPDSLQRARQTLDELARRSLLEVDASFDDGSPASWRFQPALRQEAARRAAAPDAQQQQGYAAYGAWLAQRGYADIHSDLGLNRLVRLSMPVLEAASAALDGSERLWHIRRLAWLKNAWGDTRTAFDLLEAALSPSLPDPAADKESAQVQSAIRYQLADIYNTRGDLERALALYQERKHALRRGTPKDENIVELGTVG